jgi:tetratricopeptide (TPR) repeat protein
MRAKLYLLCGAAVWANPASAADALKFGPAPSWVIPTPVPDASTKTDAPVTLLLSDQQIAFESGKSVAYAETAMRIQNAHGLEAGNISFSWNPATDVVTVNKLQIRRAGKVIDVLGSGQTFTVLRRESNLEAAMLDGSLTANIQPEGLQAGDIINLATTVEHSDPVLKRHVEGVFADWNGLPIEDGKVRVTWPSDIKMQVRQSAGLPAVQPSRRDGSMVLELRSQKIEPLVSPKGAPLRFALGRMAEATDFGSWAELADLFIPLFRDASLIPRTGSLRDELNRIRSSTSDSRARTEQALALVQDRIRYVALVMGQGTYVPASAESTWARRFGDCKAKTALLLGLLQELGIDAEPVLVNSSLGDAIGDRLPMVRLFDHVLVRARIAGRTYWLDGTRTGDTRLDDIRAPDFGWVLPLVRGARLVHVVPPPFDVPQLDTQVEIDASGGIYALAPATIEQLLRGDSAVDWNMGLASLSEAQRQEFFRSYLRKGFDFITLKSASFTFDKAKRELHVSFKGDAKLDWNGGNFHVANSTVGYDPDFERAEGPLRDAPFAVAYPEYTRTVTRLRLPASFLAGRELGSTSVQETLAGVEYGRSTTIEGDVLVIKTTARSLVPEIPYKDAIAAEKRLEALADEELALPLPRRYRPTDRDLVALAANKPASKSQFLQRGLTFLDAGKFDDAIADLTEVANADPKNVWAWANRGLAYVWKKDFSSAEKDLRAAERLDPDNSVVIRARALLAEQNGDCEAATAAYTKALQTDPRNDFVLGHRAFCEHRLGKEEAALADSDIALKSNPSWIDLRVLRANIFFVQDKKDAVVREAELLIQQNPNADYAFVAAGRIYARVDNRAAAMKAFDRALAIKPQAYIYLNRAQSRPFADRSGRLADLDAALRLNPDDPDTLAEKAEELAAKGDHKSALDLYDRAIKAAPSTAARFAVGRAVILYKTGHTTDAENILSAERAKAKTAAEFNSLCWIKATAGILLEAALQDCQEAVRLDPNSGAATDSLAFVQLRLGKIDEAIALYDRAIAKKIGSASYMGRAIAYSRKGDRARADADRAEAIRLDPDAETRFAEFGLKL